MVEACPARHVRDSGPTACRNPERTAAARRARRLPCDTQRPARALEEAATVCQRRRHQGPGRAAHQLRRHLATLLADAEQDVDDQDVDGRFAAHSSGDDGRAEAGRAHDPVVTAAAQEGDDAAGIPDAASNSGDSRDGSPPCERLSVCARVRSEPRCS